MCNEFKYLFFNPQSKAYAKAQGLPTTWSEEDQGYIARYYGYYDAEGYGTEEAGSTIRKLLLAIFILLNLFVIYTTITHGKQWYCRFCDIMKECSTSKVYSAVGISMATFNFLYLTSIVVMDTIYSISPSHCMDEHTGSCSAIYTSTIHKDEFTARIVKGVVIFIAIITELLVAIQISRKAVLPMAKKCFQIVVIWNMFIFVQIWVGLLFLPPCIFLIIGSLQTIPVLCAAIMTPPWLIAFISILLQFGSQLHIRNWDYKINTVVCIHSSRQFVFAALIVALMTLYFYLSPGGTSLSSTEGIIFSLIPPIVLSMTAWGFKKRFFNNILGKGKKTRAKGSVSSVSTEQEELHSTEEDAVFKESREEWNSHLSEESRSEIV